MFGIDGIGLRWEGFNEYPHSNHELQASGMLQLVNGRSGERGAHGSYS